MSKSSWVPCVQWEQERYSSLLGAGRGGGRKEEWGGVGWGRKHSGESQSRMGIWLSGKPGGSLLVRGAGRMWYSTGEEAGDGGLDCDGSGSHGEWYVEG